MVSWQIVAVPRCPSNRSGLTIAVGRVRAVPVEVVAVGNGQAFALARRGGADMVILHAPALELEFVRQGFGITRNCIAYNTFVIVGPAGDPAQVRSAPGAIEA